MPLSATSPPPSESSHPPPSPMRPNLDVSTPGADSRCSESSKVPVSHGVPGGRTCPRDVGSWRPRPPIPAQVPALPGGPRSTGQDWGLEG